MKQFKKTQILYAPECYKLVVVMLETRQVKRSHARSKLIYATFAEFEKSRILMLPTALSLESGDAQI